MAKAEGAATTAEQKASHLAALKSEREGYVARLAAIEGGSVDRLSPERLQGRIDEVDAEIKRIKPASKPKDDGGE